MSVPKFRSGFGLRLMGDLFIMVGVAFVAAKLEFLVDDCISFLFGLRL